VAVPYFVANAELLPGFARGEDAFILGRAKWERQPKAGAREPSLF
jgi:hypothetical protein